MNEKIDFLKTFRIFSSLSKQKLQRMVYFFKERNFSRNMIVFLENDASIDGVFFIKSGEFAVTKKVEKTHHKTKQDQTTSLAVLNQIVNEDHR